MPDPSRSTDPNQSTDAESSAMRMVPGPDSAFLSAETPEWHFHVSALLILESESSERFSFNEIRDTLLRRIDQVPQFRWKLHSGPLGGLTRPYWINDANFDIDRHLHHIALPAPGTDRILHKLVGRLMSSQLDRSRPLWEIWIIEGLEGGRTALLAKIHHSIIDGESGAELVTLLFDLEPDPATDPISPAVWSPGPMPSRLDTVLGVTGTAVRWPVQAAKMSWQLARQGATYVQHSLRRNAPTHPFQAPRTPLNGILTPSRAFASAVLSLEQAKFVKQAFDVKLNDVVLAVTAGAIRSYLLDTDALPNEPLVAQVPVSTRRNGNENAVGTNATMMFVAVGTDIEDPAERLRSIHAATRASKEMRSALSAQQIVSLTGMTPPATINLAARAWTSSRIDSSARPVFNMIVSNVPGPAFDLYVAGARIEAMYPMGPLLFGSGINFTVVSNATDLDFGVLTCPDLVPDGWDIAARLQPSLDKLLEAAEGSLSQSESGA